MAFFLSKKFIPSGSTFKRKDTIVCTNFQRGNIYLAVFLDLPGSRNKVGNDKLHSLAATYREIKFTGQWLAVFAEGDDAVGYLHAYYFICIDAFYFIHLQTGVVGYLHYIQKVIFGSSGCR